MFKFNQFPIKSIIFYSYIVLLVEKYSSHAAYANSKLAIALYTKYLQSQLPEGVGAYCLHPGVIYTQLYQHTSYLNRKFLELAPVKATMRSAENAAWDVLFLCLEEPEKLAGGWVYFENNVGTEFARVDEETYTAFVDYCKKLAHEFRIWKFRQIFLASEKTTLIYNVLRLHFCNIRSFGLLHNIFMVYIMNKIFLNVILLFLNGLSLIFEIYMPCILTFLPCIIKIPCQVSVIYFLDSLI